MSVAATPAVAIRVDDVDPGVPGRLGLWVGGHRVTGQNRRPSPCEVR